MRLLRKLISAKISRKNYAGLNTLPVGMRLSVEPAQTSPLFASRRDASLGRNGKNPIIIFASRRDASLGKKYNILI
jgi:hypothetical protein